MALLARAGAAREQLRAALHEAGAEIVLEDDPNAIDGRTLGDAAPEVVLVALESAIEDSLSRFDEVLHDPAVAVIFDEAELAARREGWEAKRWARHLSAKMNGHADVLPPGGEIDDTRPEPGLPRTPAQIHAHADIEPHLQEAQGVAFELPRGGLELVETEESGSSQSFDPETWKPAAFHARDLPLQEGFGQSPAPELAEPPPVSQPVSSPPPLPPPEPAKTGGLALELESIHAAAAASTGPVVRGAALLFAGIGGPDAVRKVLADLPADLSRPVLVQLRLDGGRYDNLVKQMERVSALPVLLAKAGEIAHGAHVYVLPNDVAVNVVEGVVHFGEGALRPEMLIASLPAAESAVLLLSGSDPAQVEAALALAAQGGLAAGQSPQGCYDPAASKALAARGGKVATTAELAAHLASHWAD
ncbi:chemotaxis protein [Pseudoxanthomonas sacheonensis]|nr:chemotaxis protein [Pseudoxanthomonas sacheonensis]